MKAIGAAILRASRDTFVGGTSLFRLAPAIPLLLLVPEFLQHVAEIQLGMFHSRDAARAVGDSPVRWAFGYAKIAGLVLCLFAAARYWGGLRGRWWDLRTIAWRAFMVGLVLNIALIGASLALERAFDPVVAEIAEPIFSLVTLPFLLLAIGPLLGDRTMTLQSAYTVGWLALPLMVGLAALAWVPGTWLHSQNHLWAYGAAPPTVWALMIWDSIWTALFVVCTGSALGAGYRTVFLDGPVSARPG